MCIFKKILIQKQNINFEILFVNFNTGCVIFKIILSLLRLIIYICVLCVCISSLCPFQFLSTSTFVSAHMLKLN